MMMIKKSMYKSQRKSEKRNKDIVILRNGKVKKLKSPYTPSQVRRFRDGM